MVPLSSQRRGLGGAGRRGQGRGKAKNLQGGAGQGTGLICGAGNILRISADLNHMLHQTSKEI